MIRERGDEFKELSLERCARACGVQRSSLYRRGLPDKDVALVRKIRKLHERFPCYGYRRVAAELGLSPKLVRGVMKRNELYARRRRSKHHAKPAAEVPPNANLLPYLHVAGPGRVFAADVTFIRLLGGCFCYVASVLDVFTRQIVGWAISSRNDTLLTKDALTALLISRSLKPCWVHHSDRGSNYTADAFQELVASCNGLLSYSDKGSPTQNAYIESFFKTFKLEEAGYEPYSNIQEAKLCVDIYLHIYNQERLHSSLGYKSPDQFYREAVSVS
ncbi:MAG TPA: IS3 family transposase [Fimbriimonadaceae bacterium]|jgi:transposase InsO family protein